MNSLTWKSSGRWILAGLAAGTLSFLQIRFGPLLAFFIPRYFPDGRMHLLLCGVSCLAGWIALFRPGTPEQACPIWWCGVRGFCWAAIAAGLFYEFTTITAVVSLAAEIPVQPPEPAFAVFGVVWVISFSVFAEAAFRLRKRPAR